MNLEPTIHKKGTLSGRFFFSLNEKKKERSLPSNNSLVLDSHIESTHLDKINIAHLLEINNDY